jgi:hypothetical protein
MSYAVLRFGVEMLRGDLVRGEWGPFTPSQWISLLIGLIGVLLRNNDFRRLLILRTKIIK